MTIKIPSGTLIMLAIFRIANSTPKICQTQSKGTLYKLDNLQRCNDLQVTEATVTIAVANVKMYNTKAKGLKIITNHCKTFTNFFGEKDTTTTSKSVDLAETAAKEMIKDKKCLSSDGKYRYDNFHKSFECTYSYLRTKMKETNTCFFYDGFVQAIHHGQVTSSIADTTACDYIAGYCKSGDTHIVWTPNNNITKDYINEEKTKCLKIKQHLVCEHLGKSFDLSLLKYSKESNTYKNGMWKIQIINTKAMIPKNLMVNEHPATDLGKQIEGLKSELQTKFQYIMDWFNSPAGRLNIICTSLLQINKLTRASLSLYASQFAEIITNSDNLVAKATKNYLAIWPCVPVNASDIQFAKTKKCYNMIPITHDKETKFMDESLIIHKEAIEVNCDKTPLKMFEINGNLYSQRANFLPAIVDTSNVSSLSFFQDFNFSQMESFPEHWQIVPEYFDTSTGLFDNIKNDVDQARKAQADMEKNSNTKIKLELFGINNLSITGYINALIVTLTRVGAALAFYLFFKIRFN